MSERLLGIRKARRYQRGNKQPCNEEGQIIQWQKKMYKRANNDIQNLTQKNPTKKVPGVNSSAPERLAVPLHM